MGVLTISLYMFLFILFTKVCIDRFVIRKHIIDFRENLDKGGIIVIPLEVGGKMFNFLVDTGSNNSYLTPEALKVINYIEVKSNLPVLTANNSTSTCLVKTCIRFRGKQYYMMFNTLELDAFTAIKEEDGIDIQGILGNDFFNNFKYTIDFSNYKVYSKGKR